MPASARPLGGDSLTGRVERFEWTSSPWSFPTGCSGAWPPFAGTAPEDVSALSVVVRDCGLEIVEAVDDQRSRTDWMRPTPATVDVPSSPTVDGMTVSLG